MKRKIFSGLAALAFFISGTIIATAKITIGLVAPITGPNAAIGAQIQRGAEMAAKEINDTGGITGKKISFNIFDDASDPKQAVSGANKLAGDGIRFVVAHYNSGGAIAASAVYDENGMLAMSPGATNPQLTDAGYPLQFRICGRDDQQAGFAADYIRITVPDPKIAIIHDKTAYGTGLAVAIRHKLNTFGIQETSYDGVNVEDKDFTALVAKIKRSDANTIYFGGVYAPAGLLLRQLADQGVKVTFIGSDAMMSNELAATAGDAVNGVINTFTLDPRTIPDNAALVSKFRSDGFEPEAYTLYSYAVVQLFKEVIENVGENPEAAALYLKDRGPFKTVLGDIAFDEKGDVRNANFTINQWHKGQDGRYTYTELRTETIQNIQSK